MDAVFTEILQLLAKALIVFLIGQPTAAALKAAQPVVADPSIVTVHAIVGLLTLYLVMIAASTVYWLIRVRSRKGQREQNVAVEPAELKAAA